MAEQKNAETSSKKESGRWSKEQHERFMHGIMLYGKDWKKVEQVVQTRTGSQVRSHAQKFFNKLQKSEKQPTTSRPIKVGEGAENINGSDTEKDFEQSLAEEGSNTTPVEIISFIKNESKEGKKINLGNFKQKLEKQMRTIQEEAEENQLQGLGTLQRRNSFKSMNNILSAYEDQKPNDQEEDQSFLIGLTKKYKKFFTKGGKFENLIDFGNPHDVILIQEAGRKRSFTLPQGVEGDENDLQQRKKKVIHEMASGGMNEEQRESYRLSVQRERQKEKKEEKQRGVQKVEEKSENQEKQNENKNKDT